MNKKKIILMIKNIENILETIKLEMDEEPDVETKPESKNIVSIQDLVKSAYSTDEPDVDYYEEDNDGPNILLNNNEEMEFYSRFKLGD